MALLRAERSDITLLDVEPIIWSRDLAENWRSPHGRPVYRIALYPIEAATAIAVVTVRANLHDGLSDLVFFLFSD